MSRQASNICRSLRPGFTLIEVLVAAAVLATISVGLLGTTWRLAAFARDEAEHMVADAYCHDVMWAIYSQNYSNMLAKAAKSSVGGRTVWKETWDIIRNPATVKSNPEELKELPRVESYDLFNRKKVTIPLWRTLEIAKVPTCEAKVEDMVTNKLITVTVRWYNGSASDPQSHSNVVSRAEVERKTS